MKQCNHCGAFIDDNAQFCTSCGTQTESGQQIIQKTTGDDGDEKRKQYIIIACVVLAVLLCVGGWFGLRGYLDNNVEVQLLPSQPVVWDKFVTPKFGQSTLYEQPDINHVYGKMGENDIAPVIDETSKFYKVYLCQGKEAWVKKNQCEEIQNAPITLDILIEMLLNGQRLECRNQTFNDGNWKGLFLFFYRDFSSEGHLEVGILNDRQLIRPMRASINAYALDKRGFELSINNEQPRLEYGINYQVKEDSFKGFLNTFELSERQVAEIWKAAQRNEPNKVFVYYYFPSINAVRYYDVDLNVYGISSSNVKYQTAEGSSTLSGFNYIVEGEYDSDMERTVYTLEIQTTSGDKINTEISDYAQELTIIAQGDYDGDGEREAIVYEWGGGNSLQPPYLSITIRKQKNSRKQKALKISIIMLKLILKNRMAKLCLSLL